MAARKQPNIVFVMGDDIGWFNISAYHQGMMASRTPNIDRLAAEGMRFTDYYAEASCTAGRANFITGQLPIRTGMTTVGQAGAKIGMPATAPTIATALRAQGYATGQFGKNHLGDRNEFLPTLHGFDEFWGYLYHLDAMEDPFHRNYPQELKDKIGPRNLLHAFAADKDDPTEDPRWGKVGKQTIVDEGPLPPRPIQGIKHDMETVDEVILGHTLDFIDKAVAANKPFFVWLNPTRMHVVTHLSEKYDSMRTSENSWGIYEAGLAQFDDVVGGVMKKLDDAGLTDNTIIVVTTDNGAENFTWPDGGQTPFAGERGRCSKAVFARRAFCVGPVRCRRAKWRMEFSRASIGFRRLSPPPATSPSRTISRKASRSATSPTRSISTDTISWNSSPAKDRRSDTKSSTSPNLLLGRCESTTTNIDSSISRRVGWAAPSNQIGRSS